MKRLAHVSVALGLALLMTGCSPSPVDKALEACTQNMVEELGSTQERAAEGCAMLLEESGEEEFLYVWGAE